MAEPMDITPSTSSASTMSVDVLGLINESRMTYGLRHQDYQLNTVPTVFVAFVKSSSSLNPTIKPPTFVSLFLKNSMTLVTFISVSMKLNVLGLLPWN
ncbi:hypothetical protein G6F42_025673 [Rhizopus arrhizus]|nr:hypothetical protein G6F42_025673 [Rhizopus arrhizus]